MNLTRFEYTYRYEQFTYTFAAPTSSGVRAFAVSEIKRVTFDHSAVWNQSIPLATVTTRTGESFKAPATMVMFLEVYSDLGPSFHWLQGLKTQIGSVMPFSQIARFEFPTAGYNTSVIITATDGEVFNTTMVDDSYFYSYFCGINRMGPFKLSMENDLKSIDFPWNSSETTLPSSAPSPSQSPYNSSQSSQTPTTTVPQTATTIPSIDYLLIAAVIAGVATSLLIAALVARKPKNKDNLQENARIPPIVNSVTKYASDVFISHDHEDWRTAEKIARGLEKAGYKTWYYERDKIVGLSYLAQTMNAIESSQAVVVLISRRSIESNQVDNEVVRTLEAKKRFIPLLLDMSREEFQKLKPEWRIAMGAIISAQIPKKGVASIIPEIITGLEALGIPKSRSSN